MTLDELRRLNIRDAGNWPLLPKIGILVLIFLAIIVAGFFLDWKDQWESLGKAEQVEVGLKTQYAEKKKRAINFDLYVQQLSEVEQSFGALVKQLPNRSEIDALLTAPMTQRALAAGVLNQDAAHRLRCRGEEVSAVLEFRVFLAHQAHPGLVNQGGGRECLVGRVVGHPMRRQFVQPLVNQRE